MRAWMAMAAVLLAATAVAAQQPPPAKVRVTDVVQQTVSPTQPVVGLVRFDRTAGVSAEVGGLVTEEYMAEGARVAAGAVLARLNTDFLRQDLAAAQAQLEQLDADIGLARKNLERFSALYRQQAASEATYDELTFRLKGLEARRRVLAAQLARKRLELAKSTIRAPFTGRIVQRFKTVGEWVNPGQPLCLLAAADPVVVEAAVPQSLVQWIKVGAEVAVTVEALGLETRATVAAVMPRGDATTKTFTVKAVLADDPRLLENMSATVQVPAGPARTMAVVPRDALVRFQAKTFVYTVADGKAKLLPVTVAASVGQGLAVTEPFIKAGMPVVVDGNERLRPDQPVTVSR